MDIDIVGDGIVITEALRELIEHKFAKILHKVSNVTHVKVILRVNKNQHNAEGFIHYGHNELFAHAESADMYKSIDELVHKLEAQALKLKDKMKDHHPNSNALDDLQE